MQKKVLKKGKMSNMAFFLELSVLFPGNPEHATAVETDGTCNGFLWLDTARLVVDDMQGVFAGREC